MAPPTTRAATPAADLPARCPAALGDLIARRTGAAVTAPRTQRSSGLLRCSYAARRSAAGPAGNPAASNCSGATVVINTESQAFTDFQRWTVETGQNAMWAHNTALNPRPVKGIGVEAEWVPERTTFETASLAAWVAVFLTCPARHPGARALGAALGRVALTTTGP
jgi:hypothetical protein